MLKMSFIKIIFSIPVRFKNVSGLVSASHGTTCKKYLFILKKIFY